MALGWQGRAGSGELVKSSPICVCLYLDGLCIEYSIFFPFSLSGTIQAFEIQKSHCESAQAGSNPFMFVCLSELDASEAQAALLSVTERGYLNQVLPFCTRSWNMDSARHLPALLTLKVGRMGKCDYVTDKHFSGVLSRSAAVFLLCTLQMPLGILLCSPDV